MGKGTTHPRSPPFPALRVPFAGCTDKIQEQSKNFDIEFFPHVCMSEDLVFIANERVWEVREISQSVLGRYRYAVLGNVARQPSPIYGFLGVLRSEINLVSRLVS